MSAHLSRQPDRSANSSFSQPGNGSRHRFRCALAPVNWLGRTLYGVISLAVVLPPETFQGAIFINAAGITAATVMLLIDWLRLRTLRKSGVEAPTTPY